MRGLLHCSVAVTAVDSKLAGMERVAKRDGLGWLIPHVGGGWRKAKVHNEKGIKPATGNS